jgi:hypothetical protein
MDVKRLAGALNRELKLDVPGLSGVVRDALAEAERRGLTREALPDFVAAEIEDGLAILDEPLERHLNEAAMKDWKGQVACALQKAQRLISGPETGE